MDHSHFIITQFNLRNFPLSENNDSRRWVEWTRNRIVLFRDYCLPSVINQSCKDFIWLVYFDSETPGEFREFIESLKAVSFIKICYCGGIDDFYLNYINEVKKRSYNIARWVITTRVDNDDCLHRDAVKTIQENFTRTHKFLISLASGYILNLTDATLSHYFYPMSPFISLIEDSEIELKGVFEKGHTKWDSLRLYIFKEIWLEYFNKKARKSRFILKKPLWIQTVHGNNVSNSFYRGFPVLKEKDLSDFSIKYTTRKQPPGIIRRYWNYVMWKRYFKSLIIKAIINK